MKIEETIDPFVNYISTERRLSARTVTIYFDALKQFIAFLSEQKIEDIEEVSAAEVRQWQMTQMERQLAPATIKQSLAAIGSWFRFLRRQKWISTDVMAKIVPPKQAVRLPVFFREQEVEPIYSSDELFPDTFQGKRDRLILRVFYETGMRRAELLGLKESSVDFYNSSVKVLGKRDKERIIPIENSLLHNIKEYLALKKEIEDCSDSLFVNSKGKPMTASQVYKVVKKYMVPLSKADKVSPHVFRHSFATHLLNEGAELEAIKELLGHANVGVTEIYTHVTREHLREAYIHAHPRAKKKD